MQNYTDFTMNEGATVTAAAKKSDTEIVHKMDAIVRRNLKSSNKDVIQMMALLAGLMLKVRHNF